MLAPDDWHLFAAGTSAEDTVTTATAGGTSGNTIPAASDLPGNTTSATLDLPGSPDQSTGSPNESFGPTCSTETPDDPPATQSDNDSDHTLNQLDVAISQLDVAISQLDAVDLRPGDVSPPLQSNPPDALVAAPTFAPPKTNPTVLPPTFNVARSSPPSVAKSQPVTSHQPRPQVGTKSANPPSSDGAATRPNVNAARKLLAGAIDEPEWMKKKKTLNYFRGVIDFGDLYNVIEHWYELEGLLGFLETVRVSIRPIQQCAHDL